VHGLQEERAALQAEGAQLKTRVEELRDELVTRKRRQAANIKDLTKHLAQGQETASLHVSVAPFAVKYPA